jgi:elongation factor 3
MSVADITSTLSGMNLFGIATTALVASVKAKPEIVPALVAQLIEQAGLSGKDDASKAANAIKCLQALAENHIHLAEAHLCTALPTVLIAAASKDKDVREAATSFVMEFSNQSSANAVGVILPHLFANSQIGVAWQVRQLSLKMIASFGENSPRQLGFALPQVVPIVTEAMTEAKKEVSLAAFEAMTAACNVIGNRDIEHMTPKIVKACKDPAAVPEIMHDLAGVTFVQSVESPALAMVVPLLLRGLKAKPTATRRQSAVIIDNMSKLVDDPVDAGPFPPKW